MTNGTHRNGSTNGVRPDAARWETGNWTFYGTASHPG